MKQRPTPEKLFVRITSEPDRLVNLHVTIVEGGSLNINLAENLGNCTKPFRLKLPQNLRDQEYWVADKEGLHPVKHTDEQH